jgi:hypothetical protein
MFIVEPTLGILPAPDKWVVLTPGEWASAELQTTIPTGFVSDLASIPWFLRGLLDVNGKSRLPALLHDWLYCGRWTERSFADQMLDLALMDYGESETVAATYYAGVHSFGWIYWNRRARMSKGLSQYDFADAASLALAQAMPPPIVNPPPIFPQDPHP